MEIKRFILLLISIIVLLILSKFTFKNLDKKKKIFLVIYYSYPIFFVITMLIFGYFKIHPSGRPVLYYGINALYFRTFLLFWMTIGSAITSALVGKVNKLVYAPPYFVLSLLLTFFNYFAVDYYPFRVGVPFIENLKVAVNIVISYVILSIIMASMAVVFAWLGLKISEIAKSLTLRFKHSGH